MRITKLFLPGRFEDAYMYMGRLVVLTENKTIRIYSLERMVSFLEEKYPSWIPIPTLMYLQNDWLDTPQFKSSIKNQEVAQAIISAFNKFPSKDPLVLDGTPFLLSEESLEIPVIVYLNMLLYNRRLYLGSDNGFYDVSIDWQNEGAAHLHKPRKKLETACYSISARYGAVAASCGDEGLFTFLNDFGRDTNTPIDGPIKISGRSLKSTWFGHDLVNYPVDNELFLFKGNLQRSRNGIEREERILTDIDPESVDLAYILDIFGEKYGIQRENIRFTYNSDKILYVQDNEGKLFWLSISRSKENDLKPGKISSFDYSTKRILTLNSVKMDLILETSNAILLLSNAERELYRIIDTGALTVRSFPRSQIFQNVVTITREDGVFLIGLYEDSQLRSSAKSGTILTRWDY